MQYISTRGSSEKVTASSAILKGIAEDGGLYVPESFPMMPKPLKELAELDYRELAIAVLSQYLSDFSEDELRQCIYSAYDDKFDTPEIAPLKEAGGYYFLELFHGKTLAFKDMALSLLPYLLGVSAKKNNLKEKLIILTATSGDTGKAALEGFADVRDTAIAVFYPENGVSDIQKLQMITQEGDNTLVAAVNGNFDDAQTAVKHLFTSDEMKEEIKKLGYVFSSANSINIGRLLPQIVYYFYGYFQMAKRGEIELGDKINFTVPTGNFGNILAGYYAMKMGLPVNKLICASNDNRVLYDFFKSSSYNINREFYCTVSPSMDILISSNLERLLYDLCQDTEIIKEVMSTLNKEGQFEFEFKTNTINGEYTNTEETYEAIGEMFEKGYTMDTHTAVGWKAYSKYVKATGDNTKNIIVSTASPYKFVRDVCIGINPLYEAETDAVKLMEILAGYSKTEIPGSVKDIDKRKINHNTRVEKEEMKDLIVKFIKNLEEN